MAAPPTVRQPSRDHQNLWPRAGHASRPQWAGTGAANQCTTSRPDTVHVRASTPEVSMLGCFASARRDTGSRGSLLNSLLQKCQRRSRASPSDAEAVQRGPVAPPQARFPSFRAYSAADSVGLRTGGLLQQAPIVQRSVSESSSRIGFDSVPIPLIRTSIRSP